MLRVFLFLLILALLWSPIALSVYWPQGWFYGVAAAEIVALVLLYAVFLIGLPVWGRRVHDWKLPFQQCGLRLQPQFAKDVGIALAIGVLGVFSLFGLETLLGWAQPATPSPRLLRFVLEGLLLALAIGFAEEMLFRGWILAELEKSYASTNALVINAVVFAVAHFIKPWDEIARTLPQFLGLVVLGLALVWSRRSPTGVAGKRLTRLGYPIGLHAGLVWGYYIVNVGGLSEYTGRVPEWVTGIDSNPLAGALGVVLLSLIGWQFAKTARQKAIA
ncbi:MAG: CPBP family intramembrane glutamic endopeptidase [Cyanobacteria bacterium P01_D01_bin.36]